MCRLLFDWLGCYVEPNKRVYDMNCYNVWCTALSILIKSVKIFCRRDVVSQKLPTAADLVDLPCDHYDYASVCIPASSEVLLLKTFIMLNYGFS